MLTKETTDKDVFEPVGTIGFAYSSISSPGFPPGPSIDRAWGAALVLLLIVMLLNLIARLVSYFFSPKGER